MIGGKAASRTVPSALGSLLQASTYGLPIPNIYGMTKTALLAIWAQNLRAGGSSKKSKKKGTTTYIENIDFLIGSNPIIGLMQAWQNATKLALNFTSYSVSASSGGIGSVTISDPHFYAVVGATVTTSFSASFDDYLSSGPVTESGTFEVPLWNTWYNGPDPTLSSLIRCWPYLYTWNFADGTTIYFPTNPSGNISGVSAFTVYYAQLSNVLKYESPQAFLRLTPEPVLADGPEYTGDIDGTSTPLSSQQVLMPAFFGAGSADYDLGASGAIADNRPEVLGSYAVYSTGDADFADMIEDTVKSGVSQVSPSSSSPTGPTTALQRGADILDYPGFVQANFGSSVAVGAPQVLQSGHNSGFGTVGTNIGPLQGTAYVFTRFRGSDDNLSSVPTWSGTVTYLTGDSVIDGGQPWLAVQEVQISMCDGRAYANLGYPPPGEVPCFAQWWGYFPQMDGQLNSYGPWTPIVLGAGYDIWTGNASAASVWYGTIPYDTDIFILDIVDGALSSTTKSAGSGTSATVSWPGGSATFPFAAGSESWIAYTLLFEGLAGQTLPVIFLSLTSLSSMSLGTLPTGWTAVLGDWSVILYGPPSSAGPASLLYQLANQSGNKLLAFWTGTNGGSTPTISSTNSDTWTTVDSGFDSTSGLSWIVANATSAGAAPGNTVSVSPTPTGNSFFWIGEGAGYDTIGNVVTVTPATAQFSQNISSSQPLGNPSSIVAFSVLQGGNLQYADPRWAPLALPQNPLGLFSGLAQWRTVYAPSSVNLQQEGSGVPVRLIMVEFNQTSAPPYPYAFGNFVDFPTMQICRQQARAYGLKGSLSQNSQKAARDWMTDFYSSMNSAPFFSGDKLKQSPYGEVSLAANGAVYTAPTSTGPIANLSDLNGDFLGDKDTLPVTIDRVAQFDAPNILQYQILNRASDYNPVVVSQPEAGSLALYGVRKESPDVHNEISNVDTARILLGIKCRRKAYIRNMLNFKLGPKAILYEPMDLVTITESLAALSNYPVRFTSLSIGGTQDSGDGKPPTGNWQVDCEAEPYVYGVHGPNPVAATDIGPYVPNPVADPGNINTPIIFEPVPRLYSSTSQAQLWCVASSSNLNYGGCNVYISTDGGNSYNLVGAINSNGITGYTTADWPSHADPDNTNSLPLDLTESLGTLSSYMALDRDNFTYPCYIAGGNSSIPYGLMTYNSAVMTATDKYTLAASGTGNELRRCVFGAPVPQPGPDVDHPNNSRWAFLGNPAQPNPPGVFKITMDPHWVGTTLYFKFLPFNTYGNTVESLSSVTAYSFTPTGIPGGGIAQNLQYVNTPSLALSQTSTTNLSLVQVSTKFGSNTVNYNARSTIAISTVSTPTWYYVFIEDPSYTGDTGAGTNLTVLATTSQANLGLSGYTYMGAIQALPSGFSGATVLPGGYPPPAANIIGS